MKPAVTMRESTIEKKVCAYWKNRGWVPIKFASPGTAGAPDRVFVGFGQSVFVEFKVPGGRLSPGQKAFHAMMENAGLYVYIVNSIEAGMKLESDIKKYLRIRNPRMEIPNCYQ